MKVLFPIGTRPEAIKCGPILAALAKQHVNAEAFQTNQSPNSVAQQISKNVHSGPTLESLPKGIMSALTCLRNEIEREILAQRPNLVVTIGDTTTALAATLASSDCGCPTAHIEAGMRTQDLLAPFPEELFRQLIDRVADFHFCVDDVDRRNLIREKPHARNVSVVQNPIYDALCAAETHLNSDLIENSIVVHLHRRELPEENYLKLLEVLDSMTGPDIIYVVMNRRFDLLDVANSSRRKLKFLNSMRHADFLNLVLRSKVVISDSGTLQEECFAFSIPHLIYREKTERPYLIDGEFANITGLNPEIASYAAGEICSVSSKPGGLFRRMRPELCGGADQIARILLSK